MERYRITKLFYKDYLIYIKKKGKYRLYGDDLKIKHYFNLHKYHLNEIKLDNLEIIDKKVFLVNRYKELYAKMVIIEGIKWAVLINSFD